MLRRSISLDALTGQSLAERESGSGPAVDPVVRDTYRVLYREIGVVGTNVAEVRYVTSDGIWRS